MSFVLDPTSVLKLRSHCGLWDINHLQCNVFPEIYTVS